MNLIMDKYIIKGLILILFLWLIFASDTRDSSKHDRKGMFFRNILKEN